jgi:hypothetical protein
MKGRGMEEQVKGFIKNPPERIERFMGLRGLCKKEEVCDQGIEPL